MKTLWGKLSATLRGRQRIESELDEEIQANLDFEIEDNIARGMDPEGARFAARRRAGNLTTTRERARDAWGFPSMESIAQDLRYGLRGIRRSPAFAVVVILTLALGIGANTAIFSVVNAILLKPLPYPAAERLLWLGESDPKAEGISVTWVNYQHWRQDNHTFENFAGYRTAHLTMTGHGDAIFTRAAVVTGGFFSLAGARPLIGRTFSAADDRPGSEATVVLSHEFWTSHFGANPNITAGALVLNGKPYNVIGVLSPGQHFFSQPIDLYLPLGYYDGEPQARAQHGSMRVLGRMKPGVTLAEARADLNHIMERLAKADPGPENEHRAAVQFLAESVTGDVRPTLLILLGAVGLVLIIACANVASLVLARSTARAREISIRAAIGAGRMRLLRQLLTENLVLAGAGGLLGLFLAQWSLRAMIALAPREIPRLAQTTFDWRVLLFAAAITTATGLLTGFAPTFAAGKTDLLGALKDSSRSATGGRGGHRYRSAMVIGEIAITLILSFAAGLVIRSLLLAENAHPGFAPENVLAVELSLPSSKYKSPEAVQAFYDHLNQDLRGLPGVVAVGTVNCPPSAGDCGDWFYSMLDRPAPGESDVPISLFNTADSGYFSTMRIPMREGRVFTDSDKRGSPRVAIINETFARKWWPNRPAVGQTIKVGGPYREGPVLEIVGVAGNVSQMGLDSDPYPEIYLPFSQSPSEAMVVMVRSNGDPNRLGGAVRRIVTGSDRDLAVQSMRTMEQRLSATLARRRFTTLILATFAVLAVVLAAVGIYGLLNYWVRVREDEIAIRLALGATRGAILGWAGSQALRLASAGTLAGLAGAWFVSRWLESLVFGIPARSPIVIATAAGAILVITFLAAVLPIGRAARVNAIDRLHHM
ncbi:MAG: ABC transporter permease [Bryobacteraceae bacterium]